MIPPINSDINSLNPNFRKKFDLWRAEVISKYPNAVVFEARRSQERQNRLYAQGRTRPGKMVTWTLNSNHKDWNAVDIVFRNNGVLQRVWPYDDLIEMAKKYGIRNLKPKETCHFEDDGTVYTPVVQKPSETATQQTTGSGIWDVSPEDLAATLELQKDKIRSWELWWLDKRTLIIIARVYMKLKQQIAK